MIFTFCAHKDQFFFLFITPLYSFIRTWVLFVPLLPRVHIMLMTMMAFGLCDAVHKSFNCLQFSTCFTRPFSLPSRFAVGVHRNGRYAGCSSTTVLISPISFVLWQNKFINKQNSFEYEGKKWDKSAHHCLISTNETKTNIISELRNVVDETVIKNGCESFKWICFPSELWIEIHQCLWWCNDIYAIFNSKKTIFFFSRIFIIKRCCIKCVCK